MSETGAEPQGAVDAQGGAPATSPPSGGARAMLKHLRHPRGQRTQRTAQDQLALHAPQELSAGVLASALLAMHMERDEYGHELVPVLLHHVQLDVSDTVRTNSGHTLLKIDLSYSVGQLHWTIYREVRDLIGLHTSLRAREVQGRLSRRTVHDAETALPSFPTAYVRNFFSLQRGGGRSGTPDRDAARAQRDAFATYLRELLRRFTLRPQTNRLCRFLELSAVALQLTCVPGTLGKQGELRIMSRSSYKSHMHMVRQMLRPKWFVVRDSFILIVEGLYSLQVYDVFLMDQEFEVRQRRHFHRNNKAYSGEHQSSEAASLSTAALGERELETQRGTAVRRHAFELVNSERRIRLVAHSEREMEQFFASIRSCASRNVFGQPNRFGSFAPIRRGVCVQWLVDGRDYFWAVSEAIAMAREHVYIHDWWLSPEMYLRRPGTPEWRLDNLLKRKAEEGVRIYVILYNEVSNQFTPTDSAYTKQRLMSLHPQIYVQRSPSHFKTGTFYWAHHEKLCVVDEMVAFVGGFDLCFGRWDTPSHALVDDAALAPPDGAECSPPAPPFLGPVRNDAEAHIWPGQDYANERIAEWHTLNRPEMDLLTRDRQPRMPWHDTGAQVIGQPARDLCRHFCQRWNMLLRSKAHSRRMPFLLPPPDLTLEQLRSLELQGTCDVQVCRSGGPWSLNTQGRVEHSVQNAYLKAIQMSERFVYIENQFFVSSTTMDGTDVENRIGLALVERIIRAHREGTPFRAVVVIPLTPGFPSSYDHSDSGPVRIITALQSMSIARGPHSLFGRLLRAGVNPHEYIEFFSLRTWGKLRHGQLTTEQVYIHGKVMVVDDRLAIIGSANINDRSQRGDRDSELAVVVQDTDMLDGRMAGEPFPVGRFAHTLRVRLMREHAGVDVDAMERSAGAEGGVPMSRAPGGGKTPSISRRSTQRGRWQAGSSDAPAVDAAAFSDPLAASFYEDTWCRVADYNTGVYRRVFQCVPDDLVKTWGEYKRAMLWAERLERAGRTRSGQETGAREGSEPLSPPEPSDTFSASELEEMEALLHTCRGTLVHYPALFLEQESMANNFLFPMDQINPLAVYD